MPDVNTALLQLVLQGIGGNDNAWGDILNENFVRVESAIAGTASVAVSGTVTLTDNQARPGIIMLTGSPASPSNVVYPDRARVFTVLNACTGTQPVTIKTASGTGIIVPRGRLVTLFCDGANIDFVQSASEIGIGGVVINATQTTDGWDNYLPCLGQNVSRTTYAKLFSKVGTIWGVGDGSSTFRLPPSDTRYFRGGQISDVGTVLADEIKEHGHSGSVVVDGNGFGSITGAAVFSDYYSIVGGFFGVNIGVQDIVVKSVATTTLANSGTVSGSASVIVNATGSFTTANTGGAETRPKSLTGLYMIRFQ